jgi:hypothetical protein
MECLSVVEHLEEKSTKHVALDLRERPETKHKLEVDYFPARAGEHRVAVSVYVLLEGLIRIIIF